jgi:Fic family protein
MILSPIMYKPPFEITSDILQLSQSISHELGILAGAKLYPVPIKLRHENKIKTIHSSLAIEGNTLTIKQVTGIIDGQKVIGHTKDITEVQNAIKVYDNLSLWDPISIQSLKQAHFMLMKGLVNHYRLKAVASITLAKRINEMKSQNYLVCGAFLVLQYIFVLVAHLDSPLLQQNNL